MRQHLVEDMLEYHIMLYASLNTARCANIHTQCPDVQIGPDTLTIFLFVLGDLKTISIGFS